MNNLEIEDTQKNRKDKHNFINLSSSSVYYGTHKPLGCKDKDDSPYFTIGPDWRYFVGLFSFFIIISIGSALSVRKAKNDAMLYISIGISLVQFVSYGYTALRNPGICHKKDIDDEEYEECDNKKAYCDTCRVLKMEDRIHCDDCQICIDQYDHHCPWTGKCIGGKNLYVFQFFLFSTIVFFIGNFILAIFSIADAQIESYGKRHQYGEKHDGENQ